MATRTLETRFERLVVADESDGGESGTNNKVYTKSKVSDCFVQSPWAASTYREKQRKKKGGGKRSK